MNFRKKAFARIGGASALIMLLVSGISDCLAAAPQPITAQSRVSQSLPRTWDALWDITWQRAAFYYPIQAATAAQQDPSCQGNLGLDVLVKNTIMAVSLKKYGDATRFIGQFQDRSLCLTRDGARGLEFALAMYVHRAVTGLPPQQAQIAVMGVTNLGMQTFDQLQYTGQSWWLMMVNIDYARIQPLMVAYPRSDLGLWMYDFRRGMMVQSGLQDGMDRVLWSMQNLNNFGRGSCMLLDMSSNNFVCPDAAGAGANGKGGAGAMEPPGGIPASGVACVLDSVKSSGVRGQFACMSRAIAGMIVDPRTAGADLAKQASQQPGIKDKVCALNDEAGGTAGSDTTTTTTTTTTSEPGKWEKFKDGVGKVKDVVVSIVSAVFDKTPPVVDTLAQAASPEGADAARGTLQILQERSASSNLADSGDTDAYYQQRAGRVMTDPQANKRTVNDPSNPNSGCSGSASSNAAARAKSLYACTNGSDMTARQPGPGLGGVRNPGSTGPAPNPTVAMLDPSQAAGPLPGTMACMMESGDIARNGPNDQRCAAMRCMPGEVCPCNRGGGIAGGQPMEVKPAVRAGPECADGPCAPAPTGVSGVLGGGTAPRPNTPPPAVGPPPKGPTTAPGGAPTPIPPR